MLVEGNRRRQRRAPAGDIADARERAARVLGSIQLVEHERQVTSIDVETWIELERSLVERARVFRIEILDLIAYRVIALAVRWIELDGAPHRPQRLRQTIGSETHREVGLREIGIELGSAIRRGLEALSPQRLVGLRLVDRIEMQRFCQPRERFPETRVTGNRCI